MPEGKYGRSYRHQRKQRLSYSDPSPYVGNSFFQTIRSQFCHLVYLLCAAQVD